jgi:hypothetical protein
VRRGAQLERVAQVCGEAAEIGIAERAGAPQRHASSRCVA